MPTYEVTVNVMYREIYVVDAESKADAQENWDRGEMVQAEAQYVDDISKVYEVEN